MTNRLSRLSIIVLFIVVMSLMIPALYNKIFDIKMGKTQLFYSPVIKKFIYREMVGEGHQFVTLDQDGKEYDRVGFETMIPFIYYKNMDLWGKLPLELDGHTFTKEDIKASRQVFELKPRMISDRRPRVPVYPLLESQPGRSRLRFPEDIFRFNDQMEFLNVDINKVDPELTRTYTTALQEAGFTFPARLVAGKVSILKPFDEGFFIVDANEGVFHIKRVLDKPQVVKTPIPRDTGIRHIQVIENKKREYHGLVLTQAGKLCLMASKDYSLVELPLTGYIPDTMDFKLLINPLFRTAIYSDNKTIHAVAMDENHKAIATYQMDMFSGKPRQSDKVFATLFPFSLTLEDKTSGYLSWQVSGMGKSALIGIILSLVVGLGVMIVRRRSVKEHWMDVAIILVTGVYGLLAVNLIGPED